MKTFNDVTRRFKTWIEHRWSPFFLAFFAFADFFIFLIPLDGLFIASVLARPTKAYLLAFGTMVGSTTGAILFYWLTFTYGRSALEFFYPGSFDGGIWKTAEQWLQGYGVWAVFATFALPIISHPILILAALAKKSLFEISIAVFTGRIIKYFTYGWLASAAPSYLKKKFLKRVNEKPHNF